MSRGNITRRGERSWRLKFDDGRDPATGARRTRFVTVRGTKRDAEKELAKLLHQADAGTLVAPERLTLADYLRAWLAEARVAAISPKTAERYEGLIEGQIIPHLGAVLVQKLRPGDIASWHAKLLAGGRRDGGPLSARTAGHAHRVLHRALQQAAATERVARNVAGLVPPPKVETEELEILPAPAVADTLTKLEGAAIRPIVVLALATGMRRGELLALRWGDVDLDGGRCRVERSLEQVKGALRFKPPKTKHGRRAITLPASAVAMLREHRRAQQEQRLALGAGKLPEDALVFGLPDGSPRSPRALSKEWARIVASRKLHPISFHGLRHTHASALIDAGVDVLKISRRLGHGSAAITLGIYGHLFATTDDRAADAAEAVLAPAARR